jgi:hypothetical protein
MNPIHTGSKKISISHAPPVRTTGTSPAETGSDEAIEHRHPVAVAFVKPRRFFACISSTK